MESSHATRCPFCGSADVQNRSGWFWVSVAIVLLAGSALVISGITDGWRWVTVAGLGGMAVVVVLNVLAAIGAPWRCAQCKRVWR